MKSLTLIIIVCCFFSAGCCLSKRTDAKYPAKVDGWKDRRGNGFRSLGTFVLKKGEITDNGLIQVEIVDIIRHDPCGNYGTSPSVARAKIRFRRVSDQKLLCEEIFGEGSSTLFGGGNVGYCNAGVRDLGVGGIGVTAINEKDEWVQFELGGFLDE